MAWFATLEGLPSSRKKKAKLLGVLTLRGVNGRFSRPFGFEAGEQEAAADQGQAAKHQSPGDLTILGSLGDDEGSGERA